MEEKPKTIDLTKVKYRREAVDFLQMYGSILTFTDPEKNDVDEYMFLPIVIKRKAGEEGHFECDIEELKDRVSVSSHDKSGINTMQRICDLIKPEIERLKPGKIERP